MYIEIKQIEEFFYQIISKLKYDGIDGIDLDYDLYWNIPSNQLYDPYNEPKQLDIGQLSEDYEFLFNSMNKDIFTSGDLRKLSYLLRYIADKLDS